MRKTRILRAVLAAMVAGAILPSCMTDVRDAAVGGALDAVSGTVSDSLRTLLPVPECLGLWWAPCTPEE